MVFQLYIKRGKATIKPYNKASWRGIVQIFFKKISKLLEAPRKKKFFFFFFINFLYTFFVSAFLGLFFFFFHFFYWWNKHGILGIAYLAFC